MIVSDLLKDFNSYNSGGVDTVEFVTNDRDFGSLILVDIVSIENILNEGEFINYRISTVRKWWLKRTYTADIHPMPYNMQISIVIEV